MVVVVTFAHGFREIREKLTGYEETPAALSTPASAELKARINDEGTEITYELSYEGIATPVTQAHIHFGKRGESGGVSVFFCSNLASAPPGTQACPPSPATITGTLKAENVVGPAAQGIAPGEFDELIRAIRAGTTYANIHSMQFPGGEVRAQIEPNKIRRHHGDHGHDDNCDNDRDAH